MRCRLLILFAFALLSHGCIPVTEPVGDIDKAEIDKSLVGTWERQHPFIGGTDVAEIEIAPEVKGNPKGLMRLRDPHHDQDWLYFLLTTVGKHKYGNVLFDGNLERAKMAVQLDKEGNYEKWTKSTKRRYFVFLAHKDGYINDGNMAAFCKLMADKKIERVGDGELPFSFYKTPAGWLTKYLEKNGPETIFPEPPPPMWWKVEK
jgi:hypothetical protein